MHVACRHRRNSSGTADTSDASPAGGNASVGEGNLTQGGGVDDDDLSLPLCEEDEEVPEVQDVFFWTWRGRTEQCGVSGASLLPLPVARASTHYNVSSFYCTCGSLCSVVFERERAVAVVRERCSSRARLFCCVESRP